MRRRLRPGSVWIHSVVIAVDHVFGERVLKMTLNALLVVKAADIGFIVAEEECRIALGKEPVRAQLRMLGGDGAVLRKMQNRFGYGFPLASTNPVPSRRGARHQSSSWAMTVLMRAICSMVWDSMRA